jgi:lipopolysaccharide transport system permease protein
LEIVLGPGRAERQYWRDLWRYRELLYFLAWRDVVVHYKQTVIGVAWAVLRPLATMLVFVFIFSKLAKLDSGGVPYPLLVMVAMLPWQMFSSALSESSNSLVNNANLISKVYFPRMLVPLSAVAVSFVDLIVSSPILAGLMIYHRQSVSWRIIAVPFLLLLTAAAAIAFGLWLSALNVRYRDVRYVVPFLVQFGLYLSPVGFSSAIIPEQFRLVCALNPMVGIIEGFRWSLLGVNAIDPVGFGLGLAVIAIFLVSGVWYFRKTERTFADLI